MRPELATTYLAPQTEIEHQLATIWQSVLQIQTVGIQDNFFDLGGHSLLVAQVHNQVKKTLGVELSIIDLFKYPTIRTLAQHLSEGQKITNPSVPLELENSQKIFDRNKKQKAAMQRHKELVNKRKNHDE